MRRPDLNRIEENWKKLKGKAKEQRCRLADDDRLIVMMIT
jgi:uncharacterized protein YjbJ (UPF0337 family)